MSLTARAAASPFMIRLSLVVIAGSTLGSKLLTGAWGFDIAAKLERMRSRFRVQAFTILCRNLVN